MAAQSPIHPPQTTPRPQPALRPVYRRPGSCKAPSGATLPRSQRQRKTETRAPSLVLSPFCQNLG
ncbi:hypothetical protein BS50DRAFT_572020 [Corynespora cassiicola Philippines]|uniref:Uncharacterized protein n=1 Tax=Corynespora cassiicola Philippines TaxID=1448308 RepID=A0A2T2NUR3_CORCC|nr:hypothetical protein BS50DRAFT_572020 [Corynespora cassiicola Philippines]